MGNESKTTGTLRLGDRVWVELLHENGTLVSLSRNGQRAVVEAGKVRLCVPVSGLGSARKVRDPQPVSGRARRPRTGAHFREIDMHGLRVEEMIQRLERFLDEAILAGCAEARVIHGHGTGALKKALHQHLRQMGFRHFRLGEADQTPGGDGVTIISL